MRPLIGITAGEVFNKDETWSPLVYGQSRTYVDAIAAAGGIPLILPIVGDERALRAMYNTCQGILVAGGNDPNPGLYGATPSALTVDVSPNRDLQEMQLLTWTRADDKPVLGICRGMQLINIQHGGSLYQDIASELPAALDHTASTHKRTLTDLTHRLAIEPKTNLQTILGVTQIGANAHHHQAVDTLGDGLRVTARAEDGIIEGLESLQQHYMVAVQAHPESLYEIEPRWGRLFESFVIAAANFRPAPPVQ